MRKLFPVTAAILAVLICFMCFPGLAAGSEDLSLLTYKELTALQADISAEYKASHTPTDAQKDLVLSATKTETQKYYAKKGTEISGWAWYDSEYTYTRDWDFYTLKTHLDYRDSKKNSHKAVIYSELYCKDGRFTVSYLKTDNTVILDNRSDYDGILWFREPKARINREMNIDLSRYTAEELTKLNKKAQIQIDNTHSVNQSDAATILGYTKLALEEYFLEKNYELRSYAWYDSEYTYIRDWDYYWLETHVDYETSSGSSKKTDKLYSEFCRIDGDLELVYLKMGSTAIADRRGELASSKDEKGIPRYNWAGTRTAGRDPEETESGNSPSDIPDTEEEDAAGGTQGKSADISLSFDTATDEELEEAVRKIREEQRSRLKTRIVLSDETLSLSKGKTARLTAEVTDLPEGQKASRISWETSDKSIASCQNGTVTGKADGQAVITASCTLTDGTEVTGECIVSVSTPVSSLHAKSNKIELGIGESTAAEVTIQPKDATNTSLQWESSNPSVASVSADGTITGEKKGTATVTASAVDGSGKQAAIMVRVTRKDDRGKTLTNSDGIALTVLSFKQTKGSGYSRADDGRIFVLVELQIENNSSSEMSVNSTFGFDAYCDDYSVDYSFMADMNTKNAISTMEVKPGKRLKGWKGFEVPDNWKELIVQFTPDVSIWGSGEKIEFVLYNQDQ